MAISISEEQLRERHLLLYHQGGEYTKIKVDKFIDKSFGIAFVSGSAGVDSRAGAVLPVPGNGLEYDNVTGQLGLAMPVNTLRFVGFITAIDQKPDTNLSPGDFYIVDRSDITLKSSDWPGIDASSSITETFTTTHQGTGYRATTGTIGDSKVYDPLTSNESAVISLSIVSGKVDSVSVVAGGTGYTSDSFCDIVSGSSGAGGNGATVKINSVDASGTITALEVSDSGSNFRCQLGEPGTRVFDVDSVTGFGMKLRADIDSAGETSNYVIIQSGASYENGDSLELYGADTGDNTVLELTLTGTADVDVNLNDKIFYKKDGTFVLLPDLLADQAILSLSPETIGTNTPYYFSNDPDRQNLRLTIHEAKEEGGNYYNGLISAEDKEKLDNISDNAGQGRVWEIVEEPEDNYEEGNDVLVGIPPIQLREYGMFAETGDPSFDSSTIGYEILAMDATKKLFDGTTQVFPRGRGLVFLAEHNEIEDIIDTSTIGSDLPGSVVMSAVDTATYMTAKNFSVLPAYVSGGSTVLGDLSIVGNLEIIEGFNTTLTARLENSTSEANDITYTWTITDPSGVVDQQISTGNSIFIDTKDNTAGLTFDVSVEADNGIDSTVASATVNMAIDVTVIGGITIQSPPNNFRTQTYEVIPVSVSVGGTNTDHTVEFVVPDVDASYYTIVHQPGSKNADITFTESSTIGANDTTSYLIESRVYSETAVDSDLVDDNDGRKYKMQPVEVIIDGSTHNPTVTPGSDLTTVLDGDTVQFSITSEGGAPVDESEYTFTTDNPGDDISVDTAVAWNIFDGDDSTFCDVPGNGTLVVDISVPLTSFDYSKMEILVDTDGDTTLEIQNNNGSETVGIATINVTTTKESVPVTNATTTFDVSELIFVNKGDDVANIYSVKYDGSDVKFYRADVVTPVDSANNAVDVTFNRPGTNHVSGTISYLDSTSNFTSGDITVS